MGNYVNAYTSAFLRDAKIEVEPGEDSDLFLVKVFQGADDVHLWINYEAVVTLETQCRLAREAFDQARVEREPLPEALVADVCNGEADEVARCGAAGDNDHEMPEAVAAAQAEEE